MFIPAKLFALASGFFCDNFHLKLILEMATGGGVYTRSKDKPGSSSKSPTDRQGATGMGVTGGHGQHSPLTLAVFQSGISDLSTTLGGKMDKISDEVNKLSNKLSDLENAVEYNSGKIADLEKTELPNIKEKLTKEIKRLEDQLTINEIYQRKANLLFYGIQKEGENENVADVLHQTFDKLGLSKDRAARIKFANAHRLPRRAAGPNTDGNQKYPTPIIAKFVMMEDRNLVLQAYEHGQRQLRRGAGAPGEATVQPARISVRTDLPPKLKARRGVLANLAYKLRREKGVSTRIMVIGANVELHTKEKGGAGANPWKAYVD